MNTSNIDATALGSDRDSALSMRAALRLLSDHIWTLLGITAAVVALVGAIVFVMTPVYSANVLVRVDARDPNALGIARSDQMVVGQQGPATDAEVAMMQSRLVLEPVLQKYGFDMTVKARSLPVLGPIAAKFGTPGKPSHPWLGLESYAWGGEQIHIASLRVPTELENAKLRLRALGDGRYALLDPDGAILLTGATGELVSGNGVSMEVAQLNARPNTEFDVVSWNKVDALKRFMRSLKVVEKGKEEAGIVQISFDNPDPQIAADVANAIAQSYVSTTVTQHRSNDSATLAFIHQELPRLRKELQDAEAKLTDYESSVGSLQPTAEAQSYLQGGIDFQRQIAELQMQRTQLLQHFTPGSGPVQTVDQQLAQLNEAKNRFSSRFNNMPASQRTNVDLTRNAKVAESIYVAMVNKAEELTVRRASTSGDVHIVDDAIRPAIPVSPNKPVVLAAGLAGGLLLGGLFVVVRRGFMAGVSDPRLFERSMSVPVFGSILFSAQQVRLERAMPRALPDGRGARTAGVQPPLLLTSNSESGPASAFASPTAQYLLARSFPHDPSVEALRGVRTALHVNVRNASDNIVVVTGPTPGTGKSFVAANLAVLEAETRRKVLLVDADMRRGRLASLFNQSPHSGGLAELLAGTLGVEQAVRPSDVPGLSLLPCGVYPHNPSELLMMPDFLALLEEFKQRFDLVIIDTPPLLAVSDAAIIASGVGKTILVLRSGAHTEEEIQETVTKLERAGAWVVGGVFNVVPLRRSERRNYGYMSAYSNHNHIAA